MRSRVALGALAAFAVLAAILWIPWATTERPIIASTPVPPPQFGVSPAPVRGGGTACQRNVTFYSRTKVAEIGVLTGGRPGPPLEITASAPGYRQRVLVPGGYRDDQALRFHLRPPSHSALGQLCIRNTGRQGVNLVATGELATTGRPDLVIDGTQQPVDAKLLFFDTVKQSYASRIGEIFGHAANFTPPFLSQPVLIVLALVTLLVIPVLVAAALSAAFREDDQAAD